MGKITKKCPLCGAKLIIERVEKLLKGGNDVASIKIRAGVCHKCGEMVFDAQTARKFEQVREKLQNGQVEDLQLVGNSYAVK